VGGLGAWALRGPDHRGHDDLPRAVRVRASADAVAADGLRGAADAAAALGTPVADDGARAAGGERAASDAVAARRVGGDDEGAAQLHARGRPEGRLVQVRQLGGRNRGRWRRDGN